MHDFKKISENPLESVHLYPFPTLWKKKIEKSGLWPVVVGGPKVRSNTPPHWYAGLRSLYKVSKNFPCVTNLGRILERDLKFHLNPNLPDCRAPMASQWRNCDFMMMLTSSKFVKNLDIHNFPKKRHLMMIDPSFFMFRRPLFRKTHFDDCRHQKMCLRQHFRSSELLMTSSWRHVTSSCRMSDFLV